MNDKIYNVVLHNDKNEEVIYKINSKSIPTGVDINDYLAGSKGIIFDIVSRDLFNVVDIFEV